MTRKEQILKAARDYVSGITLSSPSDVIHFENGAKWADNNPDLSLMWHSADEVPEDGSDVLLLDSEQRVIALNIAKLCYYEAYGLLGWPAYVANYDVKRWAYISGLLPRDTFSNEKSK